MVKLPKKVRIKINIVKLWKWLKKKRDIKVVDVLYRHEIASPRYKDRSYVGIVYCDR